MSKLLRQNIGGVDYTMAGCALTGVCASAASDFIKAVTLSDGDTASDGMMIACTFANGNSAGTAPDTLTIYSSDQVNYYTDEQLTVPFTLAPSGCYTIEYTGTGNAYTYQSYPIVVVGNVSGPLCDTRGKPAGGILWEAGDIVTLLYTGGKFLVLNAISNAVRAGSPLAVSAGAVENYIKSGDENNPISDCNSARKNGVYYFRFAQDCPPASLGYKAPDNSGSLYVQAYDNNYICQMVQDYYDKGALYIRSRVGGTWTAWQRVTVNTDWENVVSLSNGSYIKGRIESGHRVLHLHFNGYHFDAGTFTFGYLLTNLPEAWRPSETRRSMAIVDLYTGGSGAGRISTDVDLYTSGDINLYPVLVNQYSGTVSNECYVFGDTFVQID